MKQSGLVLIGDFSIETNGKRLTLRVKCSDNKQRLCYLDLLSNKKEAALIDAISENMYSGTPVRFNSFGLFNPDNWFISITPEPYVVDHIGFINHAKNKMPQFDDIVIKLALEYGVRRLHLDRLTSSDLAALRELNKWRHSAQAGEIRNKNEEEGLKMNVTITSSNANMSLSNPAGLTGAKGDHFVVYVRYESSIDGAIHTLFHELRHVHQYVSGTLGPDGYTWKGKEYTGVEYKDEPWEIDANKVANMLSEDFIKSAMLHKFLNSIKKP
jgi:hypothetical protein